MPHQSPTHDASPLSLCRSFWLVVIACLCMLAPSGRLLAQTEALGQATDATSGALEQTDREQGSVVEVVKRDGRWQLLRNGEPYFIKGAGGTGHLDKLAACGGNSVRTWDTAQTDEVLDKAHALGLTVTVGFWLGHERHGFDYSDQAAVAKQLEHIKQYVRQHKDHPAVLMWALGNEMEADGQNALIWQAINEAAEAVKEIDPNHPTTTVIAEIGKPKIENLKQYCPAIDILGVNSYGGLPSLAERLREEGLDRPYVLTEFGPLGQWEMELTEWGVPKEQTSSEKAAWCAKGYEGTIAKDKRACLGGYVFNWGSKQEVTPTWFSLFIKDTHETTEMVDVMEKFWTGEWPTNRAPSIEPIQLTAADPTQIKPGKQYKATVQAADPDDDDLKYEWIVQSETTDRRQGGDFEQTPPTHPELVIVNDGRTVTFQAPEKAGPYRLFVYIRDGQGHAATANLTFRVVP